MIKAFVYGATGYAGAELVRLLYEHPNVRIEGLSSRGSTGESLSNTYPGFGRLKGLECFETDIAEAAERSDVVFLSMPHGIAAGMVSGDILKKTKVIDLGPDFRLNDPAVFESWYGVSPPDIDVLKQSVYGLTEIYRDKIKKTKLVANPGCYTTCAILALYPLLKERAISPQGIIIDAKSGVSGAGRSANITSLFCECDQSVKAYKVASHRHTPEIEEKLGEAAARNNEKIRLVFTPHLIPMSRGILSVAYAIPEQGITYEDIAEIYQKYYGSEYFIRLLKSGQFPETRWVRGSNYCDIGFAIDDRTQTLIVVSALDNLVKGAAGQAIQNLNLMFGLSENTGLEHLPMFL